MSSPAGIAAARDRKLHLDLETEAREILNSVKEQLHALVDKHSASDLDYIEVIKRENVIHTLRSISLHNLLVKSYFGESTYKGDLK